MCTTLSSGLLLLEGVLASVHAEIPTPKCGPGDPAWVWAWRSPRYGPGDPPPDAGPETPAGCGPGYPQWVWAWRPPGQTPQLPPLGVGLETCNAC